MTELNFDFTQGATRGDIVRQLKESLGDDAWAVLENKAQEAGVPERHHHDIAEVDAAIDALAVSEQVRADLHAVYAILAEAEAQAHGCPVEQTHFHEVGEGARIRNTLLICLAFDALGADRVTASPVQTGSGQVTVAHGVMDVPTPATAAILATGIPVCAEKLEGELCTPTSAAIIKHFVNAFV